jgi:hypothetical protein
MRRFRRRLLALLVPLTILAVLGATSVTWLDQQGARARLAEAELAPALARAEAAEARAVRAEVSLTAIAVQRIADAGATATAVSRINEPQRALERALARLFAAFEEPTGPGYTALSDVFSPAALQILRAEGEYLRSTGRHLGGASTFNVDASPTQQVAADRAEVHTTERWLYDERGDSGQRERCFIEDSDQNYVLRPNGPSWLVDEIQLNASKRTDCPPGV